MQLYTGTEQLQVARRVRTDATCILREQSHILLPNLLQPFHRSLLNLEACIAWACALRWQCSLEKQLWNTEHQPVSLFPVTFSDRFCSWRIKHQAEDAKAEGIQQASICPFLSCSRGVHNTATVCAAPAHFWRQRCGGVTAAGRKAGLLCGSLPAQRLWKAGGEGKGKFKKGGEGATWHREHAKLCEVA